MGVHLTWKMFCLPVLIAGTSAARAEGPADRFAGFHVGAAAGVSQTYFVVETTVGDAEPDGRGIKAWGGAISGFLGYDVAVALLSSSVLGPS